MALNKWDANLYDSKHNFVTNYGNNVLELLNPQPHETILDLGCGSGELTATIAATAQKVVGVDFSENMIAQAQSRFPQVEFYQHDAEKPFPFDYQFDAIFSNAALHWMLNAKDVAQNVVQALKPQGRFVFEMGGNGNIETIMQAIEFAAGKFDLANLPIYNFFPSLAEYAAILESCGLRVTYAWLFDRPTLLAGNDGLRNWIRMFRNGILEQLNPEHHEEFFQLAEQAAYNKLNTDGRWFADYVRLRMVAIKA